MSSSPFQPTPPPEAGIYVIELSLRRPLRVTVGRLGRVGFAPGRYTYVGSAMRGLRSRLVRHASPCKKLHWHIDHLTIATRLTGVWVWPPIRGLECQIARSLAEFLPVVTDFGASDCRCGGHLFRSADGLPDIIVRNVGAPVWWWP